jgi:hypothetical protein
LNKSGTQWGACRIKQRTTNNNKNENMKMRKKLITALVLGACASMQVFAQNVKQDTITFALTVQQQASVSTSPSVANAGDWSQGPLYYKTATKKMTQADILKAIAIVLHGNPTYYSSQASLQLVQGELGGFWNITDPIAQSRADKLDYEWLNLTNNTSVSTIINDLLATFGIYPNRVTGSYNLYDTLLDNSCGCCSDLRAVWFPNTNSYNWYGMDPNYNGYNQPGTYDFDSNIDPTLPNPLNGNWDDRISISDGPMVGGAYARLATGRHFLPVPWLAYVDVNGTVTDATYPTTGEYPPGHMQPWGQIYVRDPGARGYSASSPLCENVTFFFYLSVEECYDCFYLSSFISDATFKIQPGAQNGPPCCSSPNTLLGKGVDYYYLTLAFDNTENNAYLNPALETNCDTYGSSSVVLAKTADQEDCRVKYKYEYAGFPGLKPSVGVADGTSPDLLKYIDSIKSAQGLPSPYEMRFTLNGIVTYSWTLEMVNANDAAADFVGTASYSANGYGFIGLVCSLITGSATFTEKVVKDSGCCDDDVPAWSMTTLNVANNFTYETGWFGPGYDGECGYYNPKKDQFNPYPYPNIVGGVYSGDELPCQYESPLDPQTALTYHQWGYPQLYWINAADKHKH